MQKRNKTNIYEEAVGVSDQLLIPMVTQTKRAEESKEFNGKFNGWYQENFDFKAWTDIRVYFKAAACSHIISH